MRVFEPTSSSLLPHDRRRELIQRLLLLQEQERREVAHELHEGAGQMLTSLLVGIKFLEGATSIEEIKRYLPSLKEHTWEALETLRLISVSLRPSLLEDLGLVPTVRSYLRDFATRYHLEGFFSVEGDEVRLAPMTEVTIFRVVQEALTNAGKYAKGSRISVAFSFAPTLLEVVIADDGQGFDPAALPGLADGEGSIGILGMQERAEFIGGTCRIESRPQGGVRVHVRVPIGSAAAAED